MGLEKIFTMITCFLNIKKYRNLYNNLLTLYLLSSSAHKLYRLDPDQAQQNVGPDLDPICKKLILKKISRRQKAGKISQEAQS